MKIVIDHKKNEIIENFLCFKDFIILETRKNGLSQLVQFNKANKKKTYIQFKDEAYTVSLSINNNYHANDFSFVFSSLKTPLPYLLKIYIQIKEESNGVKKSVTIRKVSMKFKGYRLLQEMEQEFQFP